MAHPWYNITTATLAQTFQTAHLLFEASQQFGAMDPETHEKDQYAMRRALDVLRAAKAAKAASPAAPAGSSLPTMPIPPAPAPPTVAPPAPAAPAAAFPPPAPAPTAAPLEGPGVSAAQMAQALELLDKAADAMVQSGQDVKRAVALLRCLQ